MLERSDRRQLYWAVTAFGIVLLIMAIASWLGWNYWTTNP